MNSIKKYDRIGVNLETEEQENRQTIIYDINIENHSHCEVSPTCGLLNEDGIIHSFDDPKSFWDIDDTQNGLLKNS